MSISHQGNIVRGHLSLNCTIKQQQPEWAISISRLIMSAGMHGPLGSAGGDSPGAADSTEDRYTQKERFNFQLRSPCASNHSPDNPMCLITMATHLPPDIALSVSDTHTQVSDLSLCLLLSQLFNGENVAQTVHLFSLNCPINEAKETASRGGDEKEQS